jgi:hypothetical protein
MSNALGSGRRLVLAGTGHGPLWLVLGAAALVLLVLLYRYERRLVTRRTGLTLLGLRLGAALALVASLFEPIVERVVREPRRGRVVVGVDLSDSMATADVGSPPRPRREAVRTLLGEPWLAAIRANHDLEALGFAGEMVPGSPDALAELLAKPVGTKERAGGTTDWQPVLEAALAGGDDAPTQAVVLLTDGRENGVPSPSTSPAVERLRDRGIPVYPVLIGSPTAPRDAAIAAIRAPETADRGQVVRIDVTIKADGLMPGTEVPVTLERAGGSPLRQTVRAQADGGRPVVSFRVPFESAGAHDLAATVGPIEGDGRQDNDRRPFTVVVADDKARVLVVDGEARWEFQYLRNVLLRDPRVTLEAVVLHQPAPGSAPVPFYPTTLPSRPESSIHPKTPPPPDPLGAFDTIIVGDIGTDGLSAEAWTRLESYVADRGGTLVLAAGPRSYPALSGEETVRRLMPIQDPRLIPFDGNATDPERPALPAGIALVPTLSAVSGPWPMLQFAEDPERSRAVWSDLPRLPWVLAGIPKPTATALAVPGGLAAGESDAVLAAMPFGLGKVLWVGTDSTWRWRFRVGDAYHHRFWGQVVQWAARGKLTSGNRLVQFGPVPPRVPEGTAALIRARFTETAPSVDGALLVAAKVYPAEGGNSAGARETPADATLATTPRIVPPAPTGEPVAVIPLRLRPDQPRVFDGSAPNLSPGRYIVTLDVPSMAEAMQAEGGEPTAVLEVTPRETTERIELAAARDPLERLAAVTGGRVLTMDDVSSISDLLRRRSVVRVRVEPTRLGERPEMLLLFFALLTCEWVLRKRAGLP